MSDQENKQAKQDLPADSAEQSKPSPEKQSEKQAPTPAKITAPPSKKVKNPKRVAAGKALAAKNKEKLAKIKAFEESELAKQDQQTSEATEGDQTETVKQPAEQPNSNPDWSSSVLFLVGGVAVVGGLSAFGYQKWAASANQQTSRPVKRSAERPNSNPVTQPNATESSKPAKRSEAAGDNQEKNSDPFEDSLRVSFLKLWTFYFDSSLCCRALYSCHQI